MMYQLHTRKQALFFNEVIRLHYKEGYCSKRISRILPISDRTASRWISIFALESKHRIVKMKRNSHKSSQVCGAVSECQALQERIKELEAKLLKSEIKAEAYNRMIDIAEAKFRIPIRKKAGAKQ